VVIVPNDPSELFFLVVGVSKETWTAVIVPEPDIGPFFFGKLVFACLQRLLSETSCSMRFIRHPFGFGPLQTSIIRISNEENKSDGIENYQCPVFSKILPHFLEAAAFLCFVIGLGCMYATGSIKYKGVAYEFEIPIALVFISLGWIMEHAALQLLDFGK